MPDLEAIVRDHEQTVLRTARRLLGQLDDAKDVTQEVFLPCVRHHSRITGDVGAWLHRVTVNLCNDHFRRRRPTVELFPDHPDPSPTPERIFRSKEERARLEHAVMQLSRMERFTLVLYSIEGRTSEEIACLMHAPPSTIRRRVHDTRRKLARRLLGSFSQAT
ncbi:MAG TPA: sigma-70 family RNA polymerase sigma factor [Bryobacteraceae bacterium]|jgi:RNA polymerase sigma-70 factor (ECF subfamily)